jgi:hypothetical protein
LDPVTKCVTAVTLSRRTLSKNKQAHYARGLRAMLPFLKRSAATGIQLTRTFSSSSSEAMKLRAGIESPTDGVTDLDDTEMPL